MSRGQEPTQSSTPIAASLLRSAVWHEVVKGLPGLAVVCMVAMAGVFYTAAFAVFGWAGFDGNLPLPLAIRRTMLVFVPAGVVVAMLISLLWAARCGYPIERVRVILCHTRRITLCLGITGAWGYFPLAYTHGPAMGLLGACIGAAGAAMVYRHVVLALSRQNQAAAKDSQPQTSPIDEMFLDADQ